MPDKLLVTGAQGQLGRDLTRILVGDFDVTGVDAQDADLTDRAALYRVFESVRPNTVIHCGAYTDVDGCESDRDRAMRVNADGTASIAELCRIHDARLIYISTDYVFDGAKNGAYDESDQPNPQTVYGQSKLAGEEASTQLSNHVVVRIAWLYGHYGKNFVRTMLGLAHEQLRQHREGQIIQPLKVIDDRTGCPTWTLEVVRQLRPILRSDLTGIVHVAGGGSTTWYGLATQLFRLSDLRVQVRPCTSDEYPQLAPRPVNSVLADTRLTGAGMHIMAAWQDALAEFLSNPTGDDHD